MKKIVSVLLVAVILMGMLAACGKDKKKDEPITIVGTWEYSGMDCAYIFNADGTGAYSFYGAEQPFTYTDDGSTVVITYEDSEWPNEFAYTIEGKTLHIEDSFGEIVDYTRK